MNSAVVAGGGGFIGSHVCQKLLDAGIRVVAIDNLITGQEQNIQSLTQDSNFTFINANIIEPLDGIEKKVGEANYFFHLASPASPNIHSGKSYMSFPIETLLVNSQGTYNLLELARRQNARFLFASTSEVYGDPEESPQKETYNGNVSPNGPRSVYDEGKRFGEAMVMAYCRKYEMDTRIVRIFNTYGEHMRPDDGRVVSNFIVQALKNEPLVIYGDGDQTRSFCYVSDLVSGLYEFMMRDGLAGEVINLGNPTEYSIRDIAEKIKELTGSSSEIIFEDAPEDDPRQRRPDITKAQEKLDFNPSIGVDEGFKRTIDYFRKIL